MAYLDLSENGSPSFVRDGRVEDHLSQLEREVVRLARNDTPSSLKATDALNRLAQLLT